MTSPTETLCAVLIMAALTAYVVLGGADFGGGVWDALARGPTARAQRKAIATAMGPVWEANHVWLIFAIVGTWTAFSSGFAAMFTLLAVPLIVALAGIVLRGAAFALRERAARFGILESGLGALFGATSIITPIFLGAAIGTLAAGHAGLPVGASDGWLRPFCIAVGVFALCMCALLAATYLTVEGDGEFAELFRRRAVGAWCATAGTGLVALVFAHDEAPFLFAALTGQAIIPLACALAAGLVSLGALLAKRFAVARAFVVIQVTLVLWAWAWAQYPYVVVPTLTIAQAAAPAQTLLGFAVVALVGLALLIPSLWYLFRVFKGSVPNSRPSS
jgi:cytochrome bd ubiquinol oxidase subunit II